MAQNHTQELIGLPFVCLAIVLTSYVLIQMIYYKTSASKYYMFPILNCMMLITEVIKDIACKW